MRKLINGGIYNKVSTPAGKDVKLTKKQLIFLIESALKGGIKPKSGRDGYNAIAKGFNTMLKRNKKKEMLQNMQDYGQFANSEFETMAAGQFGINYDDYESTKGVKAKELRRISKRTWNENADHEFFKNKIAKLHQLGYAGGPKDTLSLSYLSGGNTELSSWGIKSETPMKPTPEEINTCANPNNYDQGFDNFYIVLDGRVTWAGDFDAYTEELGTHKGGGATRKIAAQQTKSSGMPKRPGALRLYDDMEKNLEEFPILLDEEDVDALPNALIDEMVVDNWNIVSLTYFTSSEVVSLKDKSINEIADWCNNLKQKRTKNSPYHKLKIAYEAGYPNPRVCDYLSGRYWTDQEVQQIFSLLK